MVMVMPSEEQRGSATDGADETDGTETWRAFRDVSSSHGPRLFRHARAMLGDEARAEQAVREALTAAWRSYDDCRSAATLDPWLFTHLERSIRRRLSSRAGSPDDPGVSADRVVDDADRPFADTVVGALAELPYRQRACWLLREVEEMPFVDVAVVVGVPEPVARELTRRAGASLRARLTPSP